MSYYIDYKLPYRHQVYISREYVESEINRLNKEADRLIEKSNRCRVSDPDEWERLHYNFLNIMNKISEFEDILREGNF